MQKKDVTKEISWGIVLLCEDEENIKVCRFKID